MAKYSRGDLFSRKGTRDTTPMVVSDVRYESYGDVTYRLANIRHPNDEELMVEVSESAINEIYDCIKRNEVREKK